MPCQRSQVLHGFDKAVPSHLRTLPIIFFFSICAAGIPTTCQFDTTYVGRIYESPIDPWVPPKEKRQFAIQKCSSVSSGWHFRQRLRYRADQPGVSGFICGSCTGRDFDESVLCPPTLSLVHRLNIASRRPLDSTNDFRKDADALTLSFLTRLSALDRFLMGSSPWILCRRLYLNRHRRMYYPYSDIPSHFLWNLSQFHHILGEKLWTSGFLDG